MVNARHHFWFYPLFFSRPYLCLRLCYTVASVCRLSSVTHMYRPIVTKTVRLIEKLSEEASKNVPIGPISPELDK